jgi:hypothetical protein
MTSMSSHVVAGTIMLADSTGCRDIAALRRYHVKKAGEIEGM